MKRMSEQISDKAIGARLRAFRIQRKLTQGDVGKHLGVTFQQIQKYERGDNRIRGSRITQLCELLHIKAEQLLGNGTGIYSDEPDLLTALQDRAVSKMLVAVNKLPAHKRRAVAEVFSQLVQAFR